MESSGLGRFARRITALFVALLFPAVARAGWGDENWGEMVWGGAAPAIPSLPFEGWIALAVLLLVVSSALLAKRRTILNR